MRKGKRAVGEARREVKVSFRRWEMEWWDQVIEECREACEEGKIGENV